MNHRHPEEPCKHALKFCVRCEVPYCTRCNREWAKPCTQNHWTATWIGGGSAGWPVSTTNIVSVDGPLSDAWANHEDCVYDEVPV